MKKIILNFFNLNSQLVERAYIKISSKTNYDELINGLLIWLNHLGSEVKEVEDSAIIAELIYDTLIFGNENSSNVHPKPIGFDNNTEILVATSYENKDELIPEANNSLQFKNPSIFRDYSNVFLSKSEL